MARAIKWRIRAEWVGKTLNKEYFVESEGAFSGQWEEIACFPDYLRAHEYVLDVSEKRLAARVREQAAARNAEHLAEQRARLGRSFTFFEDGVVTGVEARKGT